jgi:hypothetical protein
VGDASGIDGIAVIVNGALITCIYSGTVLISKSVAVEVAPKSCHADVAPFVTLRS